MINGERVRQAREYRNLTQAELAEALGLNQSAIAHVEAGRSQLSRGTIETLALKTQFPVTFFHQEAGPDFPLGTLQYRAHGAATRSEKRLSHRSAELAYQIGMRLLARMKHVPVLISRLNVDPATAARMTRSAMGIAPNRPIPHVLNALERAGALVLAVAPIVMHIEAFSAWAGTESPRPVLVAVMEKAGDRGRMSACHDLGHLVLPARGDQKQAEREAFQFAAEFLMPADAMYEELAAPVTLTKLADSKARWGVAIQALVRRAKDLNIITDRQYRYLSEQIGINGWRTNEPVFIPSEKPRGLRKMVELVYGNPINVKKFADDLCLVPPLAEEILALYAPGGGSSFAGPLRDVPPPSPRGTASNVRPFRRR